MSNNFSFYPFAFHALFRLVAQDKPLNGTSLPLCSKKKKKRDLQRSARISAVQVKMHPESTSCTTRRGTPKSADNERYRATRSINIYARIDAILSRRTRPLFHHLVQSPNGRCPNERTIRAARAPDRRKRRSIWRERPLTGQVAGGREERGMEAVGTMRWDALRDALTPRPSSSRTDSTAIRNM